MTKAIEGGERMKSKTKKFVLFIDDVKRAHISLEKQIKRKFGGKEDYKVEFISAYCGEKGLEIIKNERIDVVILDLNLNYKEDDPPSDGGGSVTYEEIRKTQAFKNQSIVVRALSGNPASLEHNIEFNAFPETLIYEKKEVEFHRLIDDIEKLLENPSLSGIGLIEIKFKDEIEYLAKNFDRETSYDLLSMARDIEGNGELNVILYKIRLMFENLMELLSNSIDLPEVYKNNIPSRGRHGKLTISPFLFHLKDHDVISVDFHHMLSNLYNITSSSQSGVHKDYSVEEETWINYRTAESLLYTILNLITFMIERER